MPPTHEIRVLGDGMLEQGPDLGLGALVGDGKRLVESIQTLIRKVIELEKARK